MRIANLRHSLMYFDSDNFCAEVSVVNIGNGELIAVFAQQRGLRHTDTGTILLIRSKDNGLTWNPNSKIVLFEQGEDYGYQSAGITQLNDGTLLVHTNRFRHLVNGKIDHIRGTTEHDGVYLIRSEDRGYTWSCPEKVKIAPMRFGSVRESIIELQSGTLLMPLYGLKTDRAYYQTAYSEPMRAFVLGSTDKGRHWDYWGTIAYDASGINHYWEPGLVQLPNGRILALVRLHRYPIPAGPGEQIAPPGGYLFATYSNDDGISWSWPQNTTGIWGYPADPILLQDGKVLVAFGRRRKPMGVQIAISEGGKAWSKDQMFTIRDYDVDSVTPVFSTYENEDQTSIISRGMLWHIGYPDSVFLDTGELFIAYHLFNKEGRQYIEGAICELQPE